MQSVTFNNQSYTKIPESGNVGWSALTDFLVALANYAQTTNAQKDGVRVATTTPITVVAATDCTVVAKLASAGAVAVTLPTGVTGQVFRVMDGTGDAATNNITVSTTGGQTINGSSTHVISKDYGSATYQFNGTQWNIIEGRGSYITGSIVNADVSASAAIAYSKLNLSGSIVNADVSASAAIAYSKLNLSTSILNADVSASAAIAYSKLNLATSILNADINASAAIAVSKLAAVTASRALVSDGSGFVSASSVTATEIGYVSGVTSALQTQMDAKAAKSGDTFTGNVIIDNGKEVRFSETDANGSHYIGIKAPDSVTADKTLTLPDGDGSANQVLGTNGSAQLQWQTVATDSLNQYNVKVGDSGNTAAQVNTNLLGRIKASYTTATATMTIATPAVVTYTSHGLESGDRVYFTTDGALPTGVSASTEYVITKVDANTFKISTSLANCIAATFIASSGSQSGTHTIYTGGLTPKSNYYQGNLSGTTVPAGNIGEKISGTFSIAATSAIDATTTIPLTAGGWFIFVSFFNESGAADGENAAVSISTTTSEDSSYRGLAVTGPGPNGSSAFVFKYENLAAAVTRYITVRAPSGNHTVVGRYDAVRMF